MMSDETDYHVLIDLKKFESFGTNKEHEVLQEKNLYRIHMNHFNYEAVDQTTSSS